MKLDPNKTAGALAGMYLAQITCWAANYFWRVSVPNEIATALAGLLALILSHVPFLALNPTQAA